MRAFGLEIEKLVGLKSFQFYALLEYMGNHKAISH
jgi:hypothetical protein